MALIGYCLWLDHFQDLEPPLSICTAHKKYEPFQLPKPLFPLETSWEGRNAIALAKAAVADLCCNPRHLTGQHKAKAAAVLVSTSN